MKRRHLTAAALLSGAAVMVGTVLAADLIGVPVGVLTRDAVTTADLPPYTGAVSAFTAMVWFAAGSLCALVAWQQGRERRRLGPLAALLFVLAADDALLLHDVVGPRVGVHEVVFYVVYAVAGLAVARSMRTAERVVARAFWLGAALLATSVAVDVGFVGAHLLEDGAKLLGALVWATVPVLTQGARPPEPGGRVPGTQAEVMRS
ncbi:hypothetical protein [Geodermatophilus sp. DSM 44513]|uniref:hypothetical protein n=1 Tax=Geodermatophilus sp. DSM 44513 TaxID=1528104 RepID=UPI0028F74F4B|nr:hypothetical protein [Geodermatophilus sp. DSM 44513]WNV76407.1 hypothetical protein RTG05_03845 [Geodermatophilus sp. DSM 44513]